MLALACGLAIMFAGAVLLFQLAGQDDLADPVGIGEVTQVGDMDIAVDSVTETDGVLVVDVRIGGVADADAASGFRLVASGRPAPPIDADVSDACGSTEVTVERCVASFDTSAADGTSRVLFYERGEEQAHWVLS